MGVTAGPLPGCPPPTELCSAPATGEEPWRRAWRHLGSKLHFLIGSEEALVTASGGSPGWVCEWHAWLLEQVGSSHSPGVP